MPSWPTVFPPPALGTWPRASWSLRPCSAPPAPAESVLLLRSRLETMGSLLAEHLAPQTPVYVASQAVMDAIVGIHLHRGVLALGKRWPLPPLPEVLRDATSLLVLEDLTNHDNMGGLSRTAAALGGQAPAIILSPPFLRSPLPQVAPRFDRARPPCALHHRDRLAAFPSMRSPPPDSPRSP